jgi:hypothetical protein
MSGICRTSLRIDHGRRMIVLDFEVSKDLNLIGDRNQLAIALVSLWLFKSLRKSGIDPETYVSEMKEFWEAS